MEMKSIFQSDESDDILVWESSISGTYITNSAYYWLTLVLVPDPKVVKSWSWIWKLKLPEFFFYFVWIVMR